MRLRPSTKILIGALLIAGLWFGNQVREAQLVKTIPTPPIPAGRFTMLGLKPSDRYSILIANQTAFIAIGAGQETFSKSEGGAAGTRVPTDDLIKAKSGDAEALAHLIVRLNKLTPEDPPQSPVTWTEADVRKALDGDAGLRDRLEVDIAYPLSPGRPLPELSVSAIDNGIIVLVDVPVTYELPGGRRSVVAKVPFYYRSSAANQLAERVATKALGAEASIALYRTLAEASKENANESLRALFSPSKVRKLAESAQNLLDATFIVLTEKFITSARAIEVPPAPMHTQPTYDLHLSLTPEGRARLYRFSSVYGGRRVLVVFDGVALEGSQLTKGLNVPKFSITRIRDARRLAKLVEYLNGSRA